MTAPKKKLTLAGRPPPEVAVILAAIACGVIILAVLIQYLMTGRGLVRRPKHEEPASE